MHSFRDNGTVEHATDSQRDVLAKAHNRRDPYNPQRTADLINRSTG